MGWEMPYVGWQYLQYERQNRLFHPGIDVNGINDLGHPVYSPVEGRVVYVAGVSWAKSRLGKLLRLEWNHGFGNFIVIEQSPAFRL